MLPAIILLTACGSGAPTTEPQPEKPAPEERLEAPSQPEPGPSQRATPESATPARDGKPRVAEASEPPLERMALARASGKIGAPVDVRYLVSGVVAKDQPATVQLAFIPRVAGTNLEVQFPDTVGVVIESGARDLSKQKVGAAEALRHSLLVTPTAGDSGEIRAVVFMELDGARFFTIYSIPIGAPHQAASKPPPKG